MNWELDDNGFLGVIQRELQRRIDYQNGELLELYVEHDLYLLELVEQSGYGDLIEMFETSELVGCESCNSCRNSLCSIALRILPGFDDAVDKSEVVADNEIRSVAVEVGGDVGGFRNYYGTANDY